MQLHPRGWRPDPPSKKDRNARLLLRRSYGTYGEQANWKAFLPPVLNQRNTGSCVGQSGSGAIYTAAGIAGQKYPEKFLPSPLFSYWWARYTHGDADVDEGTYIRAFYDAARRWGICPETAWAFSEAAVNEKPDQEACRKAYDQRWEHGYYKLQADTIDARNIEMKQLIYEGGVVQFGTTVTQSFMNYRGGIIQDISGKVLGGHAMFLYGYYKNEYYMGQNSWGTGWGEQGRFRISQRLVGLFRDAWIINATPPYSGT